MNLLTVAYNYPPIRGPEAIQANRLVKYAEKEGLNFDVVTRKAGKGYKFKNNVETAGTVYRTSSLDGYFTKAFLRIAKLEQNPDAERLWYPFAVKKASELLETGNYDAVYTRSVPFTSHLVGLKLKKIYNLPWIAHFSDPWTDSIYINFQTNGAYKRNLEWESETVQAADKLIFTSDETRDLFARKYDERCKKKMFVLSHSYDKELVEEIKKLENPASSENLKIVYVGNLYGKRTPLDVFEAVWQMKFEGRLSSNGLEIIFYGAMPMKYIEEIKKRNIGDIVKYRGEVSYYESQQAMAQADVLLSIDAPTEENVFFPSKLVEYISYEKPILAITAKKGTVHRILDQNGHFLVENGDIQELKKTLLDMAEGRADFSKCNFELANDYSPVKIAKEFKEIVLTEQE